MLGTGHRTPLALVATIIVASLLMAGSGIAGPVLAHAAPATQQVGVELSQPSPAVRVGESIRVAVTVSISDPAEYLEVRLRLRTPQGRLVYQKTEIRSEVAEGRHVITFERPAEGSPLAQGRYPVEVRVLATGSEPTNASGRVLVLDGAAEPLGVAVVARLWATPAVGLDDGTTGDPAIHAGLQDDLSFITGLATSRRAPVSALVPPVLLEELGRMAEGYQTADAAAPATSARAADTLRMLADARERELVTLVDAPYAVPDLSGLTGIDARSDLDAHWTRADAILAATLRSTAASSTAYLGHSPDEGAVATLGARGSERLLLPARSVIAPDDGTASGVHPLGSTGLTAIVPDEDASAAVELGSTEFYDVLFERLGTGPVTLVLDVGPDTSGRAVSVQHAIEMIDLADWLRLVPVDTLQPPKDAQPVRLAPTAESTAPSAHWRAVRDARIAVLAYQEAAGQDDVGAESASRALLVTESELWAGPNGAWARSARAQEMAGEITDFVHGEFGKIEFDAKDVTLSGSAGEVPFTIINNTGKHLTLTIVATFEGDPSGQVTRQVRTDPMQNFVTIPVDLRNSMKSRLNIVARSGDVVVAEASLTLHTSYIDRLATVAIVIVVLLVLLAMIRRRTMSPNAGTIGDGAADARACRPDDEQ